MCIKEHFVALRRVRHKPECTTSAQLHVSNLRLIKQPAHQQAFFTPVELEGLAVLKEKRHKGFGRLPTLFAPGANKVGHRAIAAPITLRCYLNVQGTRRTSSILVS